VARTLVSALNADGIIGETFNIVGEPLLTAREYIAELEKAARAKLDVRPKSIFAFYRNDLFKWFVKVLVRHPERRFPSYRDWQSRTQRAVFDCGKAKRVLGWVPCADRARIIEEGIALPAREWLA
jgi:nucleoside-diphosphate-sugar epimerase